MCGIVGYLAQDQPAEVWQEILDRATRRLSDRGPDDAGSWFDPTCGVGLGHRRLAIIDLSPTGHQPMQSASGRYRITYNGEVYNYLELRGELQARGYSFKGASDTEVLLAGFEQWGLEQTLQRAIGMFAFALWDVQERVLYLARDRLGIKPLYYGWVNGSFGFASELKALKTFPGFKNPIDRNALVLYLRHNYIPAPYSVYERIYKLPPGAILGLKAEPPYQCNGPVRYWSARQAVRSGQENLLTGATAEILTEFDRLLREAVRQRMIADVPLGAFLSGGVDSSIVVAMMQAQSAQPVRTFSIGFTESGYNEAPYAKAVARRLGTDHTELYVTPKEAMAVIPRLPSLYDEPFADSSQIPTFLVSELTRKYVTVSLSGDGGDELFAGYNRYRFAQDIWRKIGWLPASGRRTISRILRGIPARFSDSNSTFLAPLLKQYGRPGPASDKLRKLAQVLDFSSSSQLYRQVISHWKDPAALVLGAQEPPTAFLDPDQQVDLQDYIHRMMYLDLITYLPDDILVKVDRASMGVSLEARVPLLDHRVVEFAWRLPLDLKVWNGQTKWLLRQALYRYVPEELIERPKMGFGVPIGEWLRGPLRDWAEDLLDERRLQQEGYLAPSPIRQRWAQHLSGDFDWKYYLWDVLMFQAWLEETD